MAVAEQLEKRPRYPRPLLLRSESEARQEPFHGNVNNPAFTNSGSQDDAKCIVASPSLGAVRIASHDGRSTIFGQETSQRLAVRSASFSADGGAG